MQSSRTFKQSQQEYGDKQTLPINMQLQSILLKLYNSAEDILQQQCLQNLTKIVQSATNTQQNCIKQVESVFFLLLSQIQTLQQKNTLTIDHNDYHVLEQSLQKAESQVRKHIRIQQQLKLYLDGLEEKNQTLEKQLKLEENKYMQLFETVKIMDQEKKELQRKLKKFEQKTKFIPDKDKLKGYKSVKVISESMTRAENNYSIAMYKPRPTLTHHQHSKSKISDKSSQKQKNKAGQDKKSTKMKQLDGLIEVNLSNDVHRESKQLSNLNDDNYIPTEQDVRIFREMTKTVQMKEAYKRPVRKITKHKTESKDGKDLKQTKHQYQNENRQYRSVSMYK